MSNVRRFHGAGVGGRTGLRIDDDAFDLDDFMAAGRRAMHITTSKQKEESDEEVDASIDDENRASSTMMIAHSPGPSPRSTIRRSQAPSSSSPFLSSPGTARNHPSSPSSSSKTERKASIIKSIKEQVLSEENIGSSSISSPIKDLDSRKRKFLTTGSDARREQRELEARRLLGYHTNTDASFRHSYIDEADATTIEYPVYEINHRAKSPKCHPEEDTIASSAPKEITNRDFSVTPTEVKGVQKPSKSSAKTSFKATKASQGSLVLQETNGSATQSRGNSSKIVKKGVSNTKQGKAFDIIGRDSAVTLNDPNQNQKAVIEKIPLSFHRQTSLEISEDQDDTLRRGSRYRYKPLEYWRGEKARFGRPSLPKEKEGDEVGNETIDGDAFEDHFAGSIPPVAILKEIIRVPREEGEGTFSGMKIRKERSKETDRSANTIKRVKQNTSQVNIINDQHPNPLLPTLHAEAGWDKDTTMRATIWDAGNDCETDMQIACTSSQVRTRLAVNSTFAFEKVFVVDHAMATGILSILVDGQKPLKNSKNNHYTFIVLEGAVKVQVHKASFIIAPHGMFFVPRGNDYSIENISKRTAKVAFTQCRSI